jgi:galactokinase/mevalonate kinase-like predicted kinase
MENSRPRWDYLVLTASCRPQAAAFEAELAVRCRLGLLPNVARTLVLADPEEARIGSGGASIGCLAAVLERERTGPAFSPADDAPSADHALGALRVLVLHAGGDSRRLASYGPIGKLFLPVPGASDTGLPCTLFDAAWPFWSTFPVSPGAGQVVIGCGDVLISAPPTSIVPAPSGVTGVGIRVPAELAVHHGVYVLAPDGRLRQYLQKPSRDALRACDAVDARGRAVVDSGILVFDPDAALRLATACGRPRGEHAPRNSLADAIRTWGCDLYREVCCALCHDDFAACAASARAAGSPWPEHVLQELFDALSGPVFRVHVPPEATFLHFGGTRQLLASGRRLADVQQPMAQSSPAGALVVNSRLDSAGELLAHGVAWVEGCDVGAPLRLEGENIVTGCDVCEPLQVPAGVCLDLFPVQTTGGEPLSVVRWYRIDDRFEARHAADAVYGGLPFPEWLKRVDVEAHDVWPDEPPVERRSLWTARLFPCQPAAANITRWSWMADQGAITPRDRDAWLSSPRFSLADLVREFDHPAYAQRRLLLHAWSCARDWRRLFSRVSAFSADDLAHLLPHCEQPMSLVMSYLDQALDDTPDDAADEPFRGARMLHSLGAALRTTDVLARDTQMAEAVRERMQRRGWPADVNPVGAAAPGAASAGSLLHAGTESVRRVILSSRGRANSDPFRDAPHVRAAAQDSSTEGACLPQLRSDELAWGRAPVRLDLGGGWTDTPPYSLEYGGCVVNVAVDLNGQPPVHVFARVISRPVIQVTSIDSGRTLEVAAPGELLDFGPAASEFALVKAALAQCGAVRGSPQSWRDLLDALGGGLQITTLAAVPQGSGLGTSSILGAVVLAVVNRCLGRPAPPQELFHETLRLEQLLATGGGWQDQVGGIIGGVKQISAAAGLTPTFQIDPLPDELLGDARTMLYYTGVTRYAKDVLQTVVARVLNRERGAMRVLHDLGAIAPRIAAALNAGDLEEFGRLVADVWRLNVALAPGASNSDVDRLFELVRPFVFGAKLLGAGGGGFLLLVCRSSAHADRLRQRLAADPPNPRARFVEFQVNRQGVGVGTF